MTIADRARTLTEQRRPFVHATVVRAQEPTSARPGDAAVILSDGSIEGFVGGQCAETSVRTAALNTLRNGTALLLRVLPDGAADFPESPGAQVVVNPCLSGGAIEIFLRPVLPAPVVRVAGETPIADAVATLAGFLGYEVTRDGSYEGATAVVLAGLGRGEPAGIRAALDAGVGHIALVASPRRGAAVLDGMGLTEAERARIHTPAGVWIGARTPPEIALSILTDVVKAIRLDGLAPVNPAPAQPAPAQPAPAQSAPAQSAPAQFVPADSAPADSAPAGPREAVDPICGMTVLITPDALHADGQYFCGPGCLARYTGS